MNIKNSKIKTTLIILCLLFLLIGFILIIFYFTKNLSEYVPMVPGITNLMYLPIFLWGGISSLILSLIFLILLLIQIKSNIDTKLCISFLIITVLAFGIFNISNSINTFKAYNEKTYFSDIDDEGNMIPPENSLAKYLPYYSDMEILANQRPYYSFSEYTLNNSIYKIMQTECNDYENVCAFTAEYFETDKPYLSGKFKAEKDYHFSADENGEPLNSSLIKHNTYGDIEYDIIEQSTEKIISISTEKYYFLFHYQDSMKILNLSTQEFTDKAIEEFHIMRDAY